MEGEVRSDRERDAEMDRLLRAVLADEPTTAAGACPPADELAAYAERTLTDGEREGMETHLAACRRCQEALALLATMPESSAPGPAVSPSPAWWRAGWKRWLVPLAAAATAVVLYVAISPDATLRPAAPSRESVVTSAPAQLPASPLPAVAEPAESGKAGAAVGRQQRSAPAAPRVDQPSRVVEMQGKKDLSGGERQASKAKPVRVEALPAPVVPPEMSRDVAAPVATFVGAHAPLPPPPPPPPPAASKAEAKGQLVQALPVVGGAVAADAARRQAGEAPPKVPKPLTETVTVTGATPLVQ
ncbi:MAG: zf-HC2 domain-containing protein, partial [Acidobacteria bacterium]